MCSIILYHAYKFLCHYGQRLLAPQPPISNIIAHDLLRICTPLPCYADQNCAWLVWQLNRPRLLPELAFQNLKWGDCFILFEFQTKTGQ